MADPIDALRQLLTELASPAGQSPSRATLEAMLDAVDALNHEPSVADQLRAEIHAAEQAGQLHVRQVPLSLLRLLLAMVQREAGHE
ncbi:hypothetical protein [Pseudomonas oryzihabitans]|uniref:hypothetical protein n=1 Tax=Pseudomonas oryzihabitans TaxID=47885 RepID=UPI0028942CFA|nr:hypothetical protein [Pseudomonas oryzihabitans]MDT3721533.1 hypothetical protein [Pseudomonas oryzihabitans]